MRVTRHGPLVPRNPKARTFANSSSVAFHPYDGRWSDGVDARVLSGETIRLRPDDGEVMGTPAVFQCWRDLVASEFGVPIDPSNLPRGRFDRGKELLPRSSKASKRRAEQWRIRKAIRSSSSSRECA